MRSARLALRAVRAGLHMYADARVRVRARSTYRARRRDAAECSGAELAITQAVSSSDPGKGKEAC